LTPVVAPNGRDIRRISYLPICACCDILEIALALSARFVCNPAIVRRCISGREHNEVHEMTTATILIARIRSRQRLMAAIQERNPQTFGSNPHYLALQSAVRSYRDALAQIERGAATMPALTESR
jgi:hypothetical protein